MEEGNVEKHDDVFEARLADRLQEVGLVRSSCRYGRRR